MPDGCPTSAKPSRRFNLRFGLRTLMIVITIASVLLGFVGIEIKEARRSKLVFEEYKIPHIAFVPRETQETSLASLPILRSVAGWLGEPFISQRITSMHVASPVGDDDLAELVDHLPCEILHLYDPQLTDDGMRLFARMPLLNELWLPGLEVSAAGLAELSSVKKLDMLMIRGNQITDETLASIDQLATVRKLELVHCTLTAEGFRNVAKMPALRHLFVSGSRFTAEQLDVIVRMDKLEEIETYSPGWTDKDLAKLSGLWSLRRLTISSSNISCEGLRSLLALPNLEYLSLQNMKNVGDPCLVPLVNARSLKTLVLKNTSVTDAGKRQFEAATPGCQIRLITTR